MTPRVHSRLHVQTLRLREVVEWDDPGVQHAPSPVDPLRGPPVSAAVQDVEQVPLLEGQLLLMPGLE